jgi:hypothetical protein
MKFLFIAAFLLIYIMAIIILHPLRLHVKRKYSTIALKFSFLIYLAIFLIFSYLFIFYKSEIFSYFEDPEDPRSIIHFILLMLAFFIPNSAILLRRSIKHRAVFNVVFAVINVMFSVYLWLLIDKVI